MHHPFHLLEQAQQEPVFQAEPMAPPVQHVHIPEGQYSKFYKQRQGKIWRMEINQWSPNRDFKTDEIFKFTDNMFFLSKIVNLPNDRIFLIGGAEDL